MNLVLMLKTCHQFKKMIKYRNLNLYKNLSWMYFFCGFLLLLSCSKNGTSKKIEEPEFGIYLLLDKSKEIRDVYNKDLEEWVINPSPWLTDKDVEFYDWSSHCFYLNKEKIHFFPKMLETMLIPNSLISKPFVIVANGKKCYGGYFMSCKKPSTYPLPVISERSIYYPLDVLPIVSYTDFSHVRKNEHFETCLQNCGLYDGGLTISLTDSIWFELNDTSTIFYSLKFKNESSQDLFFLDPDKCSAEYFYFNNGPILKSIASGREYEGCKYNIQTSEYPSWKTIKWYSRIKKGEVKVRNFIFKGYINLYEGDYMMEVKYSPPYEIDKTEREVDGARYWIGETKSDVVQFTISKASNYQKKILKRINYN